MWLCKNVLLSVDIDDDGFRASQALGLIYKMLQALRHQSRRLSTDQGRIAGMADRVFPTLSAATSSTRNQVHHLLGDCLPPKPRSGRVIFSGIQPTGIVHLGNYLGAISNWVRLQNEAQADDVILFAIVGWHALTLPQDPKQLSESRTNMLATLLAFGIDPKRSTLFYQEDNQDHTELAWLLSCISPFGKLRRMTTWKARLADSRNANSESEVDESMLNAGLFTYPILQAADILAYRATHVPVGEDQTQHLELTRELAESFNRTFDPENKAFFPIPSQINTPHNRILSLKDPTSKMSKSSPDPSSRIELTDTASEIFSKIRSATTDSMRGISYDRTNRRGTSNLLTILAACTGEPILQVAGRYAHKGHGELKKDVGEKLDDLLKGPRAEYERLRGEKGYLNQVAKEGAEKAKERSSRTLLDVRRMVGLC